MSRAGLTLVASVLVLGTGCILPVLDAKRCGRPIEDGDAARVLKGKTAKADLLDALGPPMAIAGRGEWVEVPAATVHHVDEMTHRLVWFGGGSWTQQGDAWLAPFAARRALRDSHRVYYWYSTSESGVALFLLVGYSGRRTNLDELWVLVDEETGLAEDAVFRAR
jgi:hypothetical protein